MTFSDEQLRLPLDQRRVLARNHALGAVVAAVIIVAIAPVLVQLGTAVGLKDPYPVYGLAGISFLRAVGEGVSALVAWSRLK